MKCLCCGKVIKDTAADKEKKNRWHSKCIKKFFGTTQMPILDLSEEKLEELASMTVNKGLTVPGVQKKLSLHLSDDEEARLTIVDYPTGYILKPQTLEYDALPEYEHLAMNLAETAGIQTVPHALMRVSGQYVYITKRIDREIKKDSIKLYAMEDFCQISNRLTQDKYKGSYESCGRIIKKYSIHPGL
ncbi:MAG: HipA domain-containing protein, partial [Lachnospiraceae bacterium]|nr:HipA domain-containing protein [Lachnospiraceae bacterium]